MSQPQWQVTGVVFPVAGDLCHQMPMLTSLGILGHSAEVIVCFGFFKYGLQICLDYVSKDLQIFAAYHFVCPITFMRKIRKRFLVLYALDFLPVLLCLWVIHERKTAAFIPNKDYFLWNIGQTLSLGLNDGSIKKKKVTSPLKEENPSSNYPAFPVMWKEIRMCKDFYED